jgi:hypothetical protein
MKKFGVVQSIHIPRPSSDGPTQDPPAVGKVFIKFADAATATKAMEGLRKRTFGGKYLVLIYFALEKFEKGDFTPTLDTPAAAQHPKPAWTPPVNLPAGGGGVAPNSAPAVPPRGGRGRGLTTPAWMTEKQQEK